jgi:hypothetical protein
MPTITVRYGEKSICVKSSVVTRSKPRPSCCRADTIVPLTSTVASTRMSWLATVAAGAARRTGAAFAVRLVIAAGPAPPGLAPMCVTGVASCSAPGDGRASRALGMTERQPSVKIRSDPPVFSMSITSLDV